VRWFSTASTKASGALGFGVFLALGVLQWGEVKLPMWGFVLGLAVAGAMIAYGLVGMVFNIMRRHSDEHTTEAARQPTGSIKAGHGIKAGGNVEAGGNIKAGRGIQAGGNVLAGKSQPVQLGLPSLLPRRNALIVAKEQLEQSRDLKDLLREGLRLKGVLDAQGDSKPHHKDDPVYHWARATWAALQHQRPFVAKDFFGDKSPYGSPYFATAYGIEVDRSGRRAYLDGRIAMLAAAVEPAVSGRFDSASHVALADTLASLYRVIRALRKRVKPERVPAYRLSLHTLKAPAAAVLEQQEAERLDNAVRQALVEHARRYVPDWDEAATLPPHDEHWPGVPMLTADAKTVAAFLDAKATVLRRIISELREGR
jgi:hypothetical protein